MLIKIPSRSDCSESEITSETLYLSRPVSYTHLTLPTILRV